ncbi:hypothetical protein AB8B21_05625 [Tardiphaga sp. 866_E4_N2_1]|uniref:hypothetical protein n=1 Tax=unclassified Tardiphaga TaxID=2631404 RepID=UPI003F20C0C6
MLFIQLFTIADDAGRARAASRLLASLLYPYDEDAASLIDGWLTELAGKGCIRRYEVGGSQYLEITKWLEHQKIDRPSASRLPPYREDETIIREDSRGSDADLVPSTPTKDHGPGPAREGASPAERDRFNEFWKEYPRRDSDEQQERAETEFSKLIGAGVDPAVITFSAKAYCAKVRKQNNYATRYVKVAWRWLGEQDFTGAAPVLVQDSGPFEPAEKDWREAVKRWIINESSWPRWAGNAPGASSCRCPPEAMAAELVCPNTTRRIDPSWYFADNDTPELAANLSFASDHKLKIKLYTVNIDGVERFGAWFMKRFPPGYDEATGEKLPPSGDEAAA